MKISEFSPASSLGPVIHRLPSRRWQSLSSHGILHDQWLLSEASDLAAAIELPSIGCRLAVTETYRKIHFEESA
jgi:hypothetical protein